MDAKKKITKYIAIGPWVTCTGAVFAGLGLVSLLAGFFLGDESGIYVVGCLFAAAIAMIFLAVGLPSFLQARKCIKLLENRGMLEQAAEELSGTNVLVIGKKKAVLTEHFLFGRKMGVALPYGDILWCYQRRMRYNLIQIIDTLVISTADTANLTAINLGRMDRHNVLAQAVAEIQRGNPRLLVGYTKENRKAYKAVKAGK